MSDWAHARIEKLIAWRSQMKWVGDTCSSPGCSVQSSPVSKPLKVQTGEAGIPERHYRLLFLLIHFFVRCPGGFLHVLAVVSSPPPPPVHLHPRISEKVNNFLWMHACFFTWLCIQQPIVLQTKGQYRKRNWNCSCHKDTKQKCTSFDIRHT